MTDGTFRGRWVAEVLRSPHITDAVRVALLAMAVDMDEAGQVSVSREDLAARLGRGKARISERLQAAVDSGLLERVVEGKRGRVAVYGGRLPFGSGYADPNRSEAESRKGPDTRTVSGDTELGSGPGTRTESEHFGSGLQTQTSAADAGKGPDCRPKVSTLGPEVRTASDGKGSAYPDPLCIRGVNASDDVEEVASDGGLFEEERVASRRPSKPKQKRSSAGRTSIPADFAVDEAMRAWARNKTPDADIDLQTDRFVNHFLDKPQIKRPGWLRSWQNWMLQQQNWHNDAKAKATASEGTRKSNFVTGTGARTVLPTAEVIDNYTDEEVLGFHA